MKPVLGQRSCGLDSQRAGFKRRGTCIWEGCNTAIFHNPHCQVCVMSSSCEQRHLLLGLTAPVVTVTPSKNQHLINTNIGASTIKSQHALKGTRGFSQFAHTPLSVNAISTRSPQPPVPPCISTVWSLQSPIYLACPPTVYLLLSGACDTGSSLCQDWPGSVLPAGCAATRVHH